MNASSLQATFEFYIVYNNTINVKGQIILEFVETIQ